MNLENPAPRTSPHQARLTPLAGAWAAAASAVLFLLFPLLRPWPDETTPTPALAEAFASERWVLAHVCGAVALGLLPGVMAALTSALEGTLGRGPSRAATIAAWLGVIGVLLFFGAEAFGIQAIAREAVTTGDTSFLETVQALRNGPLALGLFGTGLVLLAASGVLAALAVGRSGRRRWAGVPFGAALVLLTPQFFTAPPVRVAHGVLYAVGALILAGWLARAGAAQSGRRPSA